MPMTIKSKLVDPRGRDIHLQVVTDGYENPITGHRTSRDKLSANRTKAVAPSTDRQTYEDIYFGDDLGARMVDELIEDMTRKWFRLQVTMADDADAETNVEAANGMMTALRELKAKTAVKEAMTWARVYGGSLIFIGADDGGSSLESMAEPLRENAIRDIKFLDVFDRWDIDIAQEYTDPLNPKFGQPELYRVQSNELSRGGAAEVSYLIHESRTLRFDGVRVNKRRRLQNDGWHDSAYIRVQEVLSDFSISWSSAAQLLADFAPMIFKSPGLDMALAQDGSGNLVTSRLQQIDLYRSTVRMMPIDEGEELARQVTPVSGMDGLLAAFILRLCAAARMPVTKLFGQSPAGLNTTAEGDLSFWYDRVEAHQEDDIADQLRRLVDLLWLSRTGPTGGVEPKSWDLEFEKLWQMSQLEEAQARKTQSETDNNYIDSGVLMPEEVSRSRFGGDRYSYETQLDLEARAEAEQEPQPEPEPEPMAMPFPANPAQIPMPFRELGPDDEPDPDPII